VQAILQGKHKPTTAEEPLYLAGFCAWDEKRYAAAARLYADAFAAKPELEGYRGNAARAAALAASGRGTDAGQLDEKERARWRIQAIDWLRVALTLWAKQLESRVETAKGMQFAQWSPLQWQTTHEFAGIRDPAALAKLPEAEREACRKLWSDVDAFLKQAGAKK